MQHLARQGYTAAQVEAALRSPTGTYGCRFELLDSVNNVIGNFDVAPPGVQATTPGTIIEATVEMDIDRKLSGSLTLKMLPDDRLRDVPFRFRIKPYLRVGPMFDGGTCEFPCGVYVWAVPERVLAPGVEEWNVVLADELQDFDTAGPGIDGFHVSAGERDTDALKRLINIAGYFDTSGVRTSGVAFAAPRAWGLTRPQQFLGFMYMPWWQSADLGAGTFYYQTMPSGAGNFVSVGPTSPDQTRTTTILDIAQEIHDGIGYDVPWMSLDGVYQARPAVDWTTARAVTTFGTSTDSITISPMHTTNDLSKFCNRVFSWTEASGTAIFFVTADANKVVPGHPLSQARIHHYADKFITNSTADTQPKAEASARAALLDGLSMYQRIEFDTLAWPVEEPFDVVGVMVAGDAEFATQQLFQIRKYSLNLMLGVMRHEANRVYQVT